MDITANISKRVSLDEVIDGKKYRLIQTDEMGLSTVDIFTASVVAEHTVVVPRFVTFIAPDKYRGPVGHIGLNTIIEEVEP